MTEPAETVTRRSLASVGTLLVVGGLAVIVPGLKDGALALLNKLLDLHLYLEAPPWVGGTLIGVGLLLMLMAFFGQALIARGLTRLFNGRSSVDGTLIVLKHIGFSPAVRDIRQDELPKPFRQRDVRHMVIDLSHEMGAKPPRLRAALLKQLRVTGQVSAMLDVQPTLDLAYCGIAHVPFQLLAGFQLSTWVAVHSFEWDRHEHRWKSLLQGSGADLGLTVRSERVGSGSDFAIAVQVSYQIAAQDISASVEAVGEIIHISCAQPTLDCVTHKGQVSAVARLFRDQLDDLHGRLRDGQKVHVFCAAPMSIGFGIGRLISQTLHAPVVAYAYQAGGSPPYGWGLHINTSQQSQQIVRN